ncbi:protein phosphatase [Phytophthora cinnamomi]|uniref:protein phosphatase n=1 Tax=Phytophthora cinnamomi TaxID=4785 RepID=UPI0035594E2C|nr:protein phosphatase [Phytophthora cinnamomi]
MLVAPHLRALFALILASGTYADNDFQEVAEVCAGAGQFCGNSNIGPNCCPKGEYCQPWSPAYYQCVSQPAKRGVPEAGVDYWGNDIADITSLLLPEECCNRCADTLGCMAFTFVNASWDGKTHCYLKSAIGAKKSIPGAVSAAVTSPRTSSCSTQVGGYCGNKDWSLCCPYGSYCQPWNTGYYQCIKAPRHCSTQLTDVDFYGNDLGVVYGLHPTDCCEKCTQTAGCVGYTFVNDNPGKTACYLKSSIDETSGGWTFWHSARTMASLRRLLQRDAPPAAPWTARDETYAPPASHAHRERAETAPTAQLEAAGAAIPVPNTQPARVSSFPRHFFDRAGGRSSSSSSSSSDGDDLEGAGGAMTSTSYFRPRTMDGYTRYLEAAFMEGYLEKQSSEDAKLWKRRWFVMQDSKLFYYKSQTDVKEQKPSDDTCCGVISMENIDSVTTAKDFGVAAFQIRMESRRYVLRAESKDMMHEWLFNFQKSIANIVSALSRTQAEHRPNRLCNSLSRRSMSRVNRSVSFDYQDYMDQFPVAASVDDLYRGRASGGFFASTSFSDESTGGDGSSSSRTSPRRASSPLAFGSFGPRSPLMFAFDPMDDVPEHHTPPVLRSSIAESKEETTETPPMMPTSSPPVATGKYIPRYLRNRSAAEPTSPPPLPVDLSPPPEPAPAPTAGRWVPRHQREGFAEMQPIESFSINSRDSFHETFNEDSSSYSTGDDVHGVTSLLGVRSAMEDVCCCIPDLNAHLKDDEPHHQKQSFYALFDGHSGVRAATFSNQRLVPYLTAHDAFMTDTRLAFEECFARIDKEFLAKAEEESLDDGTTAAVVLIRGNRLITANIGDSRAVVSIGGQALDIIEEQTPGREDERRRIESQGGWVKEERELQLSKLHSMDLSDPEIQQRAERVVKWVTIYRVNGELAVSRAIGDIDYKGEALSKYEYWAFPEGHGRVFHGDLVISMPECQEIEITPEFDFLILACDGLWDTIKSKEAVKYVADRLNEGYSAKQASQSLANLAIRSGSSDNVSVVIVLLNTEQVSSSIDAFSRQ